MTVSVFSMKFFNDLLDYELRKATPLMQRFAFTKSAIAAVTI
jgi:hypothetical protein